MKHLLIALLLMLFALTQARAQSVDASALKTIPILHEGRVKPLDSFARLHLEAFSGKESLDGLKAQDWLAEALFDPASAAERKIFLLQDKELKRQLGLNEKERHFSFTQLQIALGEIRPQITALINQDPDALTTQQNSLLMLQSNIMRFAQIMRSFSLILPLNIQPPEKYAPETEDDPLTYLDLAKHEKTILEEVKILAQSKGQNLSAYSAEETKLAQLSLSLQLFRLAGESNHLLRLMPGAWSQDVQDWFSPWALILQGQGAPESKNYLDLWRELANAHRTQDAQKWEDVATKINATIAPKANPAKLKLETFYNALKPFHRALALYTMGLIFLIAAARKATPLIKRATLASLYGAAAIHFSGIAMRVFLLDRAPVGTLYESVVFVALICALIGFFMGTRNKNLAALLAGTLGAILMLVIAPTLINEGEGMDMLVAVLNTNFWLSTHVLCISIGYAVSVFAAGIAHAYLGLRFKNPTSALLPKLKSSLYRISIAALLFTAVGTALGGIWADQSWGRFWGWDPKENGALLIVLWLIWLQHARLSGKLKTLGFVAGTAFLNVIVALAWFGVNLLSVGLHSYGFIDGIAYSLGAFFTLEILLIGGLWILIHQKEARNAA